MELAASAGSVDGETRRSRRNCCLLLSLKARGKPAHAAREENPGASSIASCAELFAGLSASPLTRRLRNPRSGPLVELYLFDSRSLQTCAECQNTQANTIAGAREGALAPLPAGLMQLRPRAAHQFGGMKAALLGLMWLGVAAAAMPAESKGEECWNAIEQTCTCYCELVVASASSKARHAGVAAVRVLPCSGRSIWRHPLLSSITHGLVCRGKAAGLQALLSSGPRAVPAPR